ncbi:AMP-binding protein [Muricauda sp. SCSIO 64092]|uniref:AMP-binding protein n=1 Tax=Allomuricauda sp. SCSIO 64092 TaxID=2908842 RepID=UPI001FF35669|nr:AMP-binding protein [Muricauda sp. SCSIO 64092]UOY06266.1 AMP-binding protein [Muricauda sp. SCSIO 64092]
MGIHPAFKLNGIHFDEDGLYELAYSWVKEGQDFEKAAGNFLLEWLGPSESIPVQTSGSTGQPKIIEISKEFMVNSALTTGRFFELKPRSSALLCLSAQHIAGKMMLVRALILGLELDIVAPSSKPLTVHQKQYGFCAMVPLQVENSLADLQNIEKLIVGGAPISKSLRKALAKQRGTIFETYGMTETVTHIAVREIGNVKSGMYETYFRTLPDIQIERDERGCLVIVAPKVAAERIVTNDLVEIRDDTHFKWLGRFDNVINSGGVKLIPERIEEKLAPLIENRFFAFGIPHGQLGEELVLIIEGDLDREVLQKGIDNLRDLDKFEKPKQILSTPKFVETKNGKIRREETVLQLRQT